MAIDRTSTFAFVGLHAKATRSVAAVFGRCTRTLFLENRAMPTSFKSISHIGERDSEVLCGADCRELCSINVVLSVQTLWGLKR